MWESFLGGFKFSGSDESRCGRSVRIGPLCHCDHRPSPGRAKPEIDPQEQRGPQFVSAEGAFLPGVAQWAVSRP